MLALLNGPDESIAVIDGAFSLPYGDWKRQILTQRDDLLSLGIRPGDSVALITDFSIKGLTHFFALFELKACIVPLVPSSEEEIETKLSVAACNWVIRNRNSIEKRGITDKRHDLFSKIVGSAGLILFTSGSTGRPKAVLYNLSDFVNQYKLGASLLSTVMVMAFDHMGGIDTMFRIFSKGGTVICSESRAPKKILELVERHRATFLSVSPTFLNTCLIAEAFVGRDLSSLTRINYGAEPMPIFLLAKISEILPSVSLCQTFGTTETGTISVMSESNISLSIQINGKNDRYKIVDSELYVRPRPGVLGYIHDDSSLYLEGWFPTGDLVEENGDGFIKIVGRKTEVINVGGLKVLPSEIESIILEVPLVQDARVYGVSHVIMGQMVVAEVAVAQTDQPEADIKKEILSYCRQKLDRHKVPSKVVFLEKISYHQSRLKKLKNARAV